MIKKENKKKNRNMFIVADYASLIYIDIKLIKYMRKVYSNRGATTSHNLKVPISKSHVHPY